MHAVYCVQAVHCMHAVLSVLEVHCDEAVHAVYCGRAVTRPRVIVGPRLLCDSAYLEERCFLLVIGTGMRVSIRIED